MLIIEGKTFVEGIENVYNRLKGSCSMLLLTENGIIAARDKYGRTPIMIGKGKNGYAVSSETCSFPNLGYEMDYNIGPGEIVQITADGFTQLRKPNKKMQICSFLWVYYGYPVCEYEGKNVDEMRFDCGVEMGKNDDIEQISYQVFPIPGSACLWDMLSENKFHIKERSLNILRHGREVLLLLHKKCENW